MPTIFITVLLAFIGSSLAYPIFSPLFLSENGILSPLATPHSKAWWLGLALALYPFGQFIGNPCLGYLSDRIGKKTLLMWALSLSAICYGFIALAIMNHRLGLLLMCRFLSGAAEGHIAIVQSAAAALGNGKVKARNFGLISMAANIGWLIGPILGGILANPHLMTWFNYATPFYLAMLLSIANLFLLGRYFPKQPLDKRQTPTKNVSVSNQAVLKKLYGFGFLSFAAVYLFFEFFALFLWQRFSYQAWQIALLAAYISLPYVIINANMVHLVKKVAPYQASVFSHYAFAASLFLLCWLSSRHSLWISVALLGIFMTICETMGTLMVSNAASSYEQGKALGIYRGLQVLGQGIVAILGGVMASYHYLTPIIGAAILACLAGIVLQINQEIRVYGQSYSSHL